MAASSVSELTAGIRRRALEIGFDKVGIVPASALGQDAARLREWLGRGYHATMGWMERTADKRADPSLHMPSVRSVVSVALTYYTPHEHEGAPGTGKVSRYAWGDDYHDVLGERLRDLLAWIKQQDPTVEGRIAVDSSPVMDKVWAVRAGLGWMGKHSNLITRDMGSWVFLGELLLSAELDYDTEQVPDGCGTCTACIDACPTGAIVEPYVVDSSRCISYLTIELRDDEVPLGTDGWVYGCDVCQDVCPWNRFRSETADPAFQPRPGLVEPDLASLAAMTQEEFSARFRRSAIKRTKLHGIRRNARKVAEDLATVDTEDPEA